MANKPPGYYNPFKNINTKRILHSSFLEKCSDTFLAFLGKSKFFYQKEERHVGIIDYLLFPVQLGIAIVYLSLMLVNILLPIKSIAKALKFILDVAIMVGAILLAVALTLAAIPIIGAVHVTCCLLKYMDNRTARKAIDNDPSYTSSELLSKTDSFKQNMQLNSPAYIPESDDFSNSDEDDSRKNVASFYDDFFNSLKPVETPNTNTTRPLEPHTPKFYPT